MTGNDSQSGLNGSGAIHWRASGGARGDAATNAPMIAASAARAQALWAAWGASPDNALRQQLIEFYLPFARMMAGKAYGKRTYPELEFMDYLQYASIGLIESIDRFNPARGVSFETYAGVRIKGAILSGIATLSEKQEQVGARKRLIDSRVQDLAAGTEEDSAAPDDVFGKLADIAIGLALGFMLEDTGMLHDDEQPPLLDTTYQQVEMKLAQQRLQHLLVNLPENEHRIINYHYFQHLAFDEVAAILQLSKGRISQLHKQALKRLRSSMQSRDGIDLRY